MPAVTCSSDLAKPLLFLNSNKYTQTNGQISPMHQCYLCLCACARTEGGFVLVSVRIKQRGALTTCGDAPTVSLLFSLWFYWKSLRQNHATIKQSYYYYFFFYDRTAAGGRVALEIVLSTWRYLTDGVCSHNCRCCFAAGAFIRTRV